MASFNASVSEESRSTVAAEDANRTRNPSGQCAPMQSPTLGTLKLVAGNGTSVGTVMTLQCPYKTRAISGGRLSCVQDSNITHWSGGIPTCKPFSRYEDEGFRLAVLASIISSAIIIFMSIIFITSCLLKHLRKEDRKRMERERRKDEAALWQHVDQQEMRETFYSHKGRNNNNNNSKAQQLLHQAAHQSAPNVQPGSFRDLQTACRCHQQDYPLSASQPPVKPMPLTYINTQTTCVLQPLNKHFLAPLPCSGHDHTLEQPPWKQSMPTVLVTQDTSVSDRYQEQLQQDSQFLCSEQRVSSELLDKLVLQLNRIYPQILTDREAQKFRSLGVPAATRLAELLKHLQERGEEACHEFYRALHLHNEDLYLSLPTRVHRREAPELSGTNLKPFHKERYVLNSRGPLFFLCCFSIALGLAFLHYHREGKVVTGSVFSYTVSGLAQHTRQILLSY